MLFFAQHRLNQAGQAAGCKPPLVSGRLGKVGDATHVPREGGQPEVQVGTSLPRETGLRPHSS